jgi:hypothetical protein
MSRKTARTKKKTPVTTTTNPYATSGTPWSGGGSAAGLGTINYPSADKITAALSKAGLPADVVAQLAALGGKAIDSSVTSAANGSYSASSAAGLVDKVLAQMPYQYVGNPKANEAWFDVIFGVKPTSANPIGISYQTYLQAPSVVLGEVAKGATAAAQSNGVVSEVPANINLGTGYTAAELRDQTVQQEMINGQLAVANITATAQAKIGAYETLNQTLTNYDLASVAPQVYNWVFQNGITNPKELMDLVRSTDQYKQQFAGLIEQQQNAASSGTKPLTEAGYMALTQSYLNTAQTAGLPTSMLTQVDPKTKRTVMADLVAGDVSAAEFSRRVSMGYQAVSTLPQSVQDAFMKQYGLTQGDLAAYFLDPEKGMQAITNKQSAESQANQLAVQRQREALGANLGYSAQSAGLQGFTTGQASDLGEMVRVAGLGNAQDPYNTLTLGQAQKALQTASKDVALTGSAPGGTAPTVDTATLIGAQVAGYEGTNLQAAQSTALKAAQAAAAPYEKGGGYAETAKGVTGVGSGSI